MTSSALSSQAPTTSDTLRSFITETLDQGNLDLPLLPVVGNQVLILVDDPNADASKLSSLIQQDQALAAQILRIANSPAYLPRSPIVSLQQAISWLGLNMLAGLAFSVSVQSGVFTTKGFEREVRNLWRHALASGLYGKEIARRLRHNVENAFLCGLLHTIGKPVLLHQLLNHYSDGAKALEWETLEPLLQEFHIAAGGQLAKAWKLPDPVQEAIRCYPDDTYDQATSPTKGAVITCLADHLASCICMQDGIEEEALRSLPVVQDLNFYPEDMTALLDLRETIEQTLETFLL